MSPIHEALVREMLLTTGPRSTHRMLASAGINVPYREVDTIRRRMDLKEEREVRHIEAGIESPAIATLMTQKLAAAGCSDLHHATMRMFDREAARAGTDRVTAGLRILYGREVVERMAA